MALARRDGDRQQSWARILRAQRQAEVHPGLCHAQALALAALPFALLMLGRYELSADSMAAALRAELMLSAAAS